MIAGIVGIVLGVMILIAGIYLLIAHNKKMWPFKPTAEEKKQALRAMRAGINTDDAKPNTKFSVGIMVIFMLFFLLIVGLAVYMNIIRYKMMGDAINNGNTGVAMALAAPEIGSGIGSILDGFKYSDEY